MRLNIADGLRNIISGMGMSRDKASHSSYNLEELDDNQLVTMYRSSSIAKKIIDMPAEDSLREWREWQADDETIGKLEEEEKRLGLQSSMIKASKRARLFGGCAMFIGTGEEDLMQPLDPESIGLGGVKYLSVLSRQDLMAGQIEQDPRMPQYGKPVDYSLSTQNGAIPLHPSRLVIFTGDELPDERYSGARLGWGDPVLQAIIHDIRNLDATVANVASLIFEAKVDVFGISGFNEGLRSGGRTYEDLILARTNLSAQGKGINGGLLMDVNDTYTQKSASFTTLPDLLDRFMQMASAAAQIPMTLLFGMSPSGLNATGESDTRGYYDRIKVMQTLEIAPATHILNECLIRSALGSRPEEIFYNWRPLWQPTTKEKAETGKLISETFKIVSDMGIHPPEAVAKAITNGLTESGLAPGFEKDVEDFGGFQEQDDVDEPPLETPPTGEPEE